MEKIPFVAQACALWACAQGDSRGIFLNFAKFRKNFPHVPLVGKRPKAFFRQPGAAVSGGPYSGGSLCQEVPHVVQPGGLADDESGGGEGAVGEEGAVVGLVL